ncbi:MAG: helix-turn-helix domain-containing protein [Tissierellia bacterium]|nr:helix-turn-helix domain-containing protein [Tissierellia bacterium]
MKVIITLNDIMAKKKISLIELAENVDITNVELFALIDNRVESIDLTTLAAICKKLDCQPGDLLKCISR